MVTLDTVMHTFKVLQNALFLSQNVFPFHKVASRLCSFCGKEDQAVTYLFYLCLMTSLFRKFQSALLDILELPI